MRLDLSHRHFSHTALEVFEARIQDEKARPGGRAGFGHSSFQSGGK
jgi:hypothetical protein